MTSYVNRKYKLYSASGTVPELRSEFMKCATRVDRDILRVMGIKPNAPNTDRNHELSGENKRKWKKYVSTSIFVHQKLTEAKAC